MKRFLWALFSLPLVWAGGAFSFVGASSFQSDGEKAFAVAMFCYFVLLFFVAIANFFNEKIFELHARLTIGAVLIFAGVFVYVRVIS